MMNISGRLGIHIPTTKTLRAVMLLALALGAGAAFAGGRTLWLQEGVRLSTFGSVTDPEATDDGAGGGVVVWADGRDWPEGVYAQRVDAGGTPLWAADGVLVCDSTGPVFPSVIGDGEHGVIVVWSAIYDNGPKLVVQRVSAGGVRLWGTHGLTLRPYVAHLKQMPAMVSDGFGGAIVAWDAVPDGGQGETLIACRVDSTGLKRWEATVRTGVLMDAPSLCSDGLGGAIITWREYETPSYRAFAQRIDGAGATRWGSSGVPICTLAATQGLVVSSTVGDSRFVVGFYVRVGEAWQYRAQLLDLAGNRHWGPTGVPVSDTSSTYAGAIGLANGVAGQLTWVWAENRAGTYDVFAQKLDSGGARCWDTAGVCVGTSETSEIHGFAASTDQRAGAIVAWTLSRSRLNWDVYGQHVDSTGDLIWSDTGIAVCADDNNVRSPVALTDGEGGAIVAWVDDRGLYAQRVADVAGVEETPYAEVRATKSGPTVVRGVLFLSEEATSHEVQAATLLNASGRKVAMLHMGANDVSALAPGVYFVRGESQVASHKLFAKVVVTR